MSDEEWQVIKPLMPWPAWLQGNGERRRLIRDPATPAGYSYAGAPYPFDPDGVCR